MYSLSSCHSDPGYPISSADAAFRHLPEVLVERFTGRRDNRFKILASGVVYKDCNGPTQGRSIALHPEPDTEVYYLASQ